MKTSRRGEWVAAAIVIMVPALAAFFISASESPTEVPRVTQVIQSLGKQPGDDGPADSPVSGKDAKGLSIDFKRGATRVALGTMEIPSVRLRTKFYDGVVDEAVRLGPGHWPGTPWPGEKGNSVFAGHRTTYTHPFANLDLLDRGARVNVRMRNGRETTYRVFRTLTVSEAEYADAVLEQPRNGSVRMITLFACTPKGSRTHRIIVQAKVTSSRTRSNANEEARR